MNGLTKRTAQGAALFIGIALASPTVMAQGEEGGYVYNHGEQRFVNNVYNFLKHFHYDQYYWCQSYLFTSWNDYYVDAMDIAYYSGLGANWFLGMGPGANYPKYVSIGNNTRWGDQDLEFIVFESSAVIPSALDRWNWYSPWVGDYGAFQGLHQAIGYRTGSYSDNGISSNFGHRIASGQAVWQSWFHAVDDERSWWMGSSYPGFASAVLYPGLDYDTYYSFGWDPPAGHSSLRNYYQY